MKKAIYILYALMLILMPMNTAAEGEPADTKGVEPNATLSVPFQENHTIAPGPMPLVTVRTPKKKEKDQRFFELTAYTAYDRGQNGKGITASGTTVREGRTASCPKSLDFGTKIYIPSLDTTYVCEDRGSAIIEGHLDIFIKDYDRAMKFGRRKEVEVIVLSKEDPI